jgi:hypothetical protein
VSEPLIEAAAILAAGSGEPRRVVPFVPRWPKGRPAPNKGWKMARVNGWGPLHDQRSKLSKRVKAIERQLRKEYMITKPLWRDRISKAAVFQALAEEMLSQIGKLPSATPPRASKLQRTSDHLLRYVPVRPERKPQDLADVLRSTR